jgi:hypothetical protein
VTSVANGECVGSLPQSLIGNPDAESVSLSQAGSDLTATRTDGAAGVCTFTGSAGASSIVLNWSRCDIGVVTGITCANGARRDMRMLTNPLNGSVAG